MSRDRFDREHNPNWQGGRRTDGRGYVYIWVGKDHPMASASPYVAEHRLVMAQKLGRWLTSDEVVHHRDEDKGNNDPDNLELWDRARHMIEHYKGKPRSSASAQERRGGRWAATPREVRGPRKKGPKPKSLAERLWPKVDIRGEDECWEFRGQKMAFGYGRFFLHGKVRTPAHRVAYTLTKGEIPEGLVVRHTCDNPACCNPGHLILGTRNDNNQDRAERKRGREHRQFGEANAFAKLSDEDVQEVHRLRSLGLTQQAIADRIGIKQPHVSRILRGVSRAHGSSIQPPP